MYFNHFIYRARLEKELLRVIRQPQASCCPTPGHFSHCTELSWGDQLRFRFPKRQMEGSLVIIFSHHLILRVEKLRPSPV